MVTRNIKIEEINFETTTCIGSKPLRTIYVICLEGTRVFQDQSKYYQLFSNLSLLLEGKSICKQGNDFNPTT